MGEEEQKEHHHLHGVGGFVSSVAGGVGGGMAGNALGLGQVGGIASSVAGSMGGQKAEQKMKPHDKKWDFTVFNTLVYAMALCKAIARLHMEAF